MYAIEKKILNQNSFGYINLKRGDTFYKSILKVVKYLKKIILQCLLLEKLIEVTTIVEEK